MQAPTQAQADGERAPLEHRLSKLYDVPLHPSAILDAGASAPGRETYRVALPVEGLANYYRLVAGMGDNMSFGAFQWCSGSRTGTPTPRFERVWRKASTNDYLVLQGTADAAGSRLGIIEERGNAARSC